jgi:hypothetical protein
MLGRQSEVETPVRLAGVYDLADGKIRRPQIFLDPRKHSTRSGCPTRIRGGVLRVPPHFEWEPVVGLVRTFREALREKVSQIARSSCARLIVS